VADERVRGPTLANEQERHPQKLSPAHHRQDLSIFECGYKIYWAGKVTLEAALIEHLDCSNA
jgi:hypothetical protein